MNKRQVISSLNNIAEELDNQGLYVEAKQISNVMKKIAQMEVQTPPKAPSGEASPKEALDFYTQQMSGQVEKEVKNLRKLLQVVIANFQSKQQFFNDPVYGAELKKLLTEDMGVLNSMISAYNNFPKSQ